MTSKTNYAMFAIAAFAVMGYGITPAFANGAVSEQITMNSGNNTIPEDDLGCGSSDRCSMSAAAIAGYGSQDWTVSYGPDGNTECDVVVSVIGGSSWNESRTFYNLDYETSTTINGPTDIEVDDVFTVTANYSNCS